MFKPTHRFTLKEVVFGTDLMALAGCACEVDESEHMDTMIARFSTGQRFYVHNDFLTPLDPLEQLALLEKP